MSATRPTPTHASESPRRHASGAAPYWSRLMQWMSAPVCDLGRDSPAVYRGSAAAEVGPLRHAPGPTPGRTVPQTESGVTQPQAEQTHAMLAMHQRLQTLEQTVQRTSPLLEQAAARIEDLTKTIQRMEQVLKRASKINPFGDVANDQVAQSAQGLLLERRGYSLARIAWELERTALGDGYYGNALRVAKDLREVGPHDRALLDRYATGKHTSTDHVALQSLALRIDEVARRQELIEHEMAAHDQAGHGEHEPETEPGSSSRSDHSGDDGDHSGYSGYSEEGSYRSRARRQA